MDTLRMYVGTGCQSVNNEDLDYMDKQNYIASKLWNQTTNVAIGFKKITIEAWKLKHTTNTTHYH